MLFSMFDFRWVSYFLFSLELFLGVLKFVVLVKARN